MRTPQSTRMLVAVLSASFVVAACGQKPGVHVESNGLANPQQPGVVDQTATTGDPMATETTDGLGTDGATVDEGTDGSATTGGTTSGTAGGTTGGTTDGSATTGGTTGGTTGETTDGTSGGTTGGQQQVTGQDRTGVTDDKIVIGVHAPVTGAAPIPATSFREARNLYWEWQANDKKRDFLGRKTVEVLFADDTYDPASARAVCRDLARQSFMVAGGGGTDQIQACGAQAGVQRYLYFSSGVTEAGLEGNDWYFASSMTYRQQGVLLASYLKKNFAGQKFAMVVTDTPNFNDAVQGFETGVQQSGIGGDYHGVIKHAKGDTTWYSSVASTLHNANVEVVYMLTAPTDYINFAKQAKQSGYGTKTENGGFQYVGVGVTKALNTVLGTGCDNDAVHEGIFFSPFPGLDWARKNEPDFFAAAQKYGKVADDLALALWGLNKQFDTFLGLYGERYGTDLTREDFRNLAENTPSLKTNLFPEIGYTPDNHFGGKQVHVLQARCDLDPAEHVTLQSFVSAF
jgi:ABC-type branched-subunit amino acid transport system substrate-binding protein